MSIASARYGRTDDWYPTPRAARRQAHVTPWELRSPYSPRVISATAHLPRVLTSLLLIVASTLVDLCASRPADHARNACRERAARAHHSRRQSVSFTVSADDDCAVSDDAAIIATPAGQMYASAHLLAMTGWVAAVNRVPQLPAEQRLPYFVGFALLCWFTMRRSERGGIFPRGSR